MIDVNVSYGTWPFMQAGWKSLEELDEHMDACGINQALVSHLGTVWDPDVEQYNRQLIAEAVGKKRVVPIPVVNPSWPVRYEGYYNDIDLVGVKVFPSFHGYSLLDPAVGALATYLVERKLVIFIQMRMEDERMQHPLARVDSVDIEEVLKLHVRFPALKIICLNAYLPEVRKIASQSREIGFDTSFCEWLFTLECMMDVLPLDTIFLGTHSPFLYTKAGILKISESRVSTEVKEAVLAGNAARLLRRIEKDSA